MGGGCNGGYAVYFLSLFVFGFLVNIVMVHLHYIT
jgi:hypothetical protein